MVTIRSVNEIILSLIDFFKLAQPDLDTKPGTVARDLFIEGPASQIALLYDEMSGIANRQSLRLVVGSDLDKLAKNFGVVRKQATTSSGAALLTFSSLNSTINVNRGDVITANNGFSFTVANGVSIVPTAINFYKSVAAKFRDQLDFAGISDTLAVQVTANASSPGSSGNIGTYSLSRTSVPGISNVTNVNPFTGGTDQETDASFRNRVLSSFSGSSVGTALGYLNVALSTTGVSDAAVIQPGDPLMTRDGTQVSVAADGTRTVVSEGSGGKVDVVVLGQNLVENTESFIFQDKSNKNDPTNTKNDVVLGQIAADANKTINRKRIDDIKAGVLPAQPVDTILQVTGSLSGSNFQPKSVDSLGRVSGNYELVFDTGAYGGSPWGFDTFHWISNKVSLFSEDEIRGQYNGQDATTFKGVLEIPQVQQSISITNENSTVTTDRSIIQLLHTPATNVTRVFNVKTGERYLITNQNLDSTGTFNTTGRIQISGNTLPSAGDQLQVDYNWIVNYDQYSDYDGLALTKNPRSVTDSIDWGYASVIKNERILFGQTVGNNFYTGNATHPINTVLTAKQFTEIDGYVQLLTSGTFINRLAVILQNLALPITSVDSVKFKNSAVEIYDTASGDQLFTVATQIVGIQILNSVTIILPTDTTAQNGDHVTAIMNSLDVFQSGTTSGSSAGNQVTIPSSLITSSPAIAGLSVAPDQVVLLTTYISNVADLFSSSISTFPASRVGNGYTLTNNNGFTNFSQSNVSRKENQVVQKNNSNQFYVEISVPASDFTLDGYQVSSVVRLTDGYELWTDNHPGTITTGTSGNYQLILSGFNTPVIGDRVLVVYYTTDIRRFQPFSYNNYIVKKRIDKLGLEPISGKLSLSLNKFKNATNLTFKVLEPNTDYVWFTGTDGYIFDNGDGTALFSSLTVNFSSLADLTNKKLQIIVPTLLSGNTDCTLDGVYDITAYSLFPNELTITENYSKITADQISVIRVLDGQEVWNYSGSIDVTNNRLLIPASPAASVGDIVYVSFFNFRNLRKASTRVIGTTSDQITNPGVLTVNGTTIAKADSFIFTATNTGLRLNLAEALRKALGLNSISAIPSNVRIAKIIKVEKVITESPTDDSVLEVSTTYDTFNTTIRNNLLYADEMLGDSTLGNLDFVLPSTKKNTLNTFPVNLPTTGDKIRVTFYYVTDNDSESLAYTRNGTLYTNKKFAIINRFFQASGFKASQATRFTGTSFTQPSLGARYKVFYDYTAPKQNERIVVRYNYNKLISDVTFAIENTRPINADVLVRGAKEVLLDLTINVVIDPTMISSSTTVLQNLRDKLVTALTTTTLGQIVDQPTIINVAQGVNGISRARILFFNKNGSIGTVLKITAQEDEFFSANTIIINTETR